MFAETVPFRFPARLLGFGAACWLVQMNAASAFPVNDPTNPSVVPIGRELAAPDARDLQHQMGLLAGFGDAGFGWTILPRISLQEVLNDNVLEVHSPRRWDLISVLSPGVAIQGNTSRVQLRLDYAPTLDLYARTHGQSGIGQQLNSAGTVVLLPEHLFVDVRGVVGVQAANGAIGGYGGLGQGNFGGIGGATQPDTLGLSRQNRAQTSSFSVSPYALQRFGNFGTGKVGISLNAASSSLVRGFAPLPFEQGPNSQRQTSVEETLQFQTGPQFVRFRDTVAADNRQTQSRGTGGGNSFNRSISDRLDYAISRTISVYGSLGWEDIHYGGANRFDTRGVTWAIGTTLTPNEDSQISLGYGHQAGIGSVQIDARYALSARTVLTASYSTGVGTQLDQLGNQLDLATVGNNGDLLNGQTGGPLFVGNNALGITPGVYRTTRALLSAHTVLARDAFTLTLSSTQSEQVGATNAATNTVRGAKNAVQAVQVVWDHTLNEDLSATASASYSIGSPQAGFYARSLALGLSLQYRVSETVSSFVRYSFFDRQANVTALSLYQNLVILGVTKQF